MLVIYNTTIEETFIKQEVKCLAANCRYIWISEFLSTADLPLFLSSLPLQRFIAFFKTMYMSNLSIVS